MAQFDERIGAEQNGHVGDDVAPRDEKSRDAEHLAADNEGPVGHSQVDERIETTPNPARPQEKVASVLHVVGRPSADTDDTYEEVISLSKTALPNFGYRVTEIRVPATVNPFKDPATVFRLHRMFPEQDVVHAHGLHAAALAIMATTGLPASARPKIVVTVPRHSTGAVNDRDMTARTLIAARADAVLGATATVVERFRSVPTAERALLPAADVVDSLNPDRTRAEVHEYLQIPQGSWLLASTAALAENGGLKTLLEAARTFSARRPEFSVVLALAGDGGFKPALADEVDERDVPVLVIDESDAVDVLSAADVVLATDKMSVLDADQIMQLTRPIVSVGRLGRKRFGSAAAHITEGDAAGVIDAVANLLADPQRRGVAAIEARSRVLGSASPHDVIGQLVRVYREALARRKRVETGRSKGDRRQLVRRNW